MKPFIKKICSGLFLLMVVQVNPNHRSVNSSGSLPEFLAAASATTIHPNIWIEDPSDDNPGEVRDQIFILPSLGRSVKRERDHSSVPAQQSLLDPLFLDRPPPPVNIS